MTSSKMLNTENFNAIRFIRMLIKWKKQLLQVFIASAIISYLLTFLITPLYKSNAVVYPYNLNVYSKESATEQMVQLLKSEDVREDLIKAFDLYKHYDIDSTGSAPRTKIMKQLDENISINKTEYESVEMNILDADPMIAKRMCDSMIVFMDHKALHLLREKAGENLKFFGRRLAEKKAEMDSMVAEETKLSMEYGVLDYENQTLGFTREYYHYLGQGGSSSKMEQEKRNLEEKGNVSFSLKENLWRVRGQYNELKKVYEDEAMNFTKDITFHNQITKAVAAEKRDSPKRTLLALLVTISVTVLAILVIIYFEFYKKRFEAELSE